MGLLVDGKWEDHWYDTKKTGGSFQRQPSSFRRSISSDGSAPFPAESGRYQLYVSLACPWAHRTLIFRKLKGLSPYIDITIVSPLMLNHGWAFTKNFSRVTGDPLFGFDYLYQLYCEADPNYTGRVTVPVLWDKKTKTIVSNESADIIRMFNSAFNTMTNNSDDYYPVSLREKIDAINDTIYRYINNGVYQCGFATTQAAYQAAIIPLFAHLDELENRLAHKGPYLLGETLTESDWRLFTTLIRFDPVYVGHFKCNIKQIRDYPFLYAYLKRLFHYQDIAETVDFDHIKAHYYYSHTTINPTQIIPYGPELNEFMNNPQ